MRYYNWNTDKNEQLMKERGVSFERVVILLNQGHLLDVIAHPNQERYPHQRMFILEMDGYCYLVPFVEHDEEIFLKTIIPSRKATKKYLR